MSQIQSIESNPLPVASKNKCDRCTNSKCCTYITQKIETPRSKYDFEHLLWQISHRGIQVYKDSDGWYLLIQNTCSHLLDNGACGIYQYRPQICRDHDNDYCEFDEPAEKNFLLFFNGYDSLRAYCKKRFRRWTR